MYNSIKYLTPALLLLLLFSCFNNAEEKVIVSVRNYAEFDRPNELAEVPLEQLAEKIKLSDGLSYIVRTEEGDEIPSQVTHDGFLVFPAGMKADERKEFLITAGKPSEYEHRTYGRHVKERKDDFAWENDCVAFRIYGPALLPIDGPSNGIDLWYKKTNKLVLDKWYADDLAGKASYHDDHGEGLDDYKVGRSLGAGAMAPFYNNKLCLNRNYTSQELLDNGPLRTTFRVLYDSVDVNGKNYYECRTISLDAGSYLTKIVQEYDFSDPFDVAAGFTLRNDDFTMFKNGNYMVYPEPPTSKAKGIYLGMVIPQGFRHTFAHEYKIPSSEKGAGKYGHVLALTTYQPGKPITYYTGYGWEEHGFPTMSDFVDYVEKYSESVKNPLVVTIY